MPLLHEFDVLRSVLLLLIWAVGGSLVVLAAYDLEAEDRPLVGIGFGMVLSTWLTNFLGRLVPIGAATWLAAGLVLVLGLLLGLPHLPRTRWQELMQPGRVFSFLALALLFTLLGRGLALFDDTQNLPFLSRIAAGDLPPHFPFNPTERLGYHYLLLLLAAEWMGAARALPWTALDLARGVTMALTFLLVGRLAFRLTRRPVVEWMAVGFSALAGGSRWMMLFMPVSFLASLSGSISLLGSGANTAQSLDEALVRPWSLDGGGPIPFPFAYASGVYPPRILALSGTGTAPLMVIVLLLLAGDRVRSRWGWVLITILLSALALLSEPAFVLIVAGMIAALGLGAVVGRRRQRSRTFWSWLVAAGASLPFVAIQGGLLTEVAREVVGSSAGQGSYYDVTFQVVWPPAVISSHLGELPLTDPLALVAAFLEFGPMVMAFPLVVAYAVGALKEDRHGETALIVAAVLSLATVLVRYSGIAGPTATTRLYGLFGDVCLIYAVPLGWQWLEQQGARVQLLGALAGFAAVFSGLVILGIQFVAVPRPVASSFLTDLDRHMFRGYWNSLPPQSMVFDPVPSRAVTVLGRAVPSQADLSGPTDGFRRLAEAPTPARLRQAGFDFVYADRAYWERHREALSAECVRIMGEVVDIGTQTGEIKDYRRLADIRGCH